MRPQLFKTRITELFGIRHPILCGGLMHLADARYVAAVVNAGGMGFVTALSSPDADHFRTELRECGRLTDGKPFGVNFAISRRPGINQRLVPYIDAALDEGVRLIETSGDAPTELLPRLKAAGCIVMHKAPAVRFAQSAERLGVDAVAVVGAECGGHPGQQMIGTMVLAPLAGAQLSLPLAIGGGIGNGSQLVAALAMGADAILMGTRMTVAEEVWSHAAIKQRVVELGENDSRVVLAALKFNHRVMDNETARKVAALEATGETEYGAYGDYVKGTLTREAYETGDWSRGLIDMGPACVFADAVKPVDAIFDEILDDALVARERLKRLAA